MYGSKVDPFSRAVGIEPTGSIWFRSDSTSFEKKCPRATAISKSTKQYSLCKLCIKRASPIALHSQSHMAQDTHPGLQPKSLNLNGGPELYLFQTLGQPNISNVVQFFKMIWNTNGNFKVKTKSKLLNYLRFDVRLIYRMY